METHRMAVRVQHLVPYSRINRKVAKYSHIHRSSFPLLISI